MVMMPGQFVRVLGPAGPIYRPVDLVDITNRAKVPAIGIVREKPSATRALVQCVGEVVVAGLTPGERYFVGPAGTAISENAFPTPPAGVTYWLQLAGYAVDSSILQLAHDLRLTALDSNAGKTLATASILPPSIMGGTNVTAADLSSGLLDYSNYNFVTEVTVMVNGVKLNAGLSPGFDVWPGLSPAAGDLKFGFPLRNSAGVADSVTMLLHKALVLP
jgi:hypothetical protein